MKPLWQATLGLNHHYDVLNIIYAVPLLRDLLILILIKHMVCPSIRLTMIVPLIY